MVCFPSLFFLFHGRFPFFVSFPLMVWFRFLCLLVVFFFSSLSVSVSFFGFFSCHGLFPFFVFLAVCLFVSLVCLMSSFLVSVSFFVSLFSFFFPAFVYYSFLIHKQGSCVIATLVSPLQYILRNLPPNMRYKLKLAGVTQAIFSKRFLVGEFTTPVSFILGGTFTQLMPCREFA